MTTDDPSAVPEPIRSVVLLAPAGAGPSERLGGHAARLATGLVGALKRRQIELPVEAIVVRAGANPAERDKTAARVADLLRTGRLASPVLAISLVPQASPATEALVRAVVSAVSAHGAVCRTVVDWHVAPRLVGAFTSATYEALDAVWSFGSSDRAGYDWALGSKMATPVVFVAPLWPAVPGAPASAAGDERYRELVEETARQVAERLDLHSWSVALLPAAAGADPVAAGPAGEDPATELDARLGDLAARRETDVVISPVGSIADDEWLLSAVDVAAQQTAQRLGLHIDRARSLNDDPVLIAALADLVMAQRPSDHPQNP